MVEDKELPFEHDEKIDKEKVKNGEPHKFDELKWFTLNTFPPENAIHSQT